MQLFHRLFGGIQDGEVGVRWWECRTGQGQLQSSQREMRLSTLPRRCWVSARSSKTALCSAQIIRKWLLGWGCQGGWEAAPGSWERASWGGSLNQRGERQWRCPGGWQARGSGKPVSGSLGITCGLGNRVPPGTLEREASGPLGQGQIVGARGRRSGWQGLAHSRSPAMKGCPRA